MAEFIEEAERIFGQRWAEVMDWLASRKTIDAIETMIAAGRGIEVLDADDLKRAGEVLAADTADMFREAAERVASRISERTENLVRYDVTNPRAVDAMRSQSLRMVQGLTEEQRDTIRTVLRASVEAGENPRETARAIRSSIGLTPAQAQAVANYRRDLERGSAAALDRELRDRRSDRSVERALETGKPLKPEQIDRMVDRYREGWVNYRAETIARTEATRAVHEGATDAWNQAIDNGDVRADQLVRTWHAATDSRTRDSHRRLNGQQVGIDEPFETDGGALLRYPGDPSAPADEIINCRCTVSVRMTGL